MRKVLVFLFILTLSYPLLGQTRTGNIYGKIVDAEGNPLPGVIVTLTGSLTAPIASTTSAEGNFRFISLPPAGDYKIKATLQGFKTVNRENIIISVGSNVTLTLTMEMGTIEEEVTVTAVNPVLDAKKTTLGANISQEILQELPTARDPWVILQMAPSIVIDRENVGGSQSGQQSRYAARGTGRENSMWAMDGILITDPSSSLGASPGYFDFDSFEEMQITVGGADVTTLTAGVAINMVTRRGGNKLSFGGRFYVTEDSLQANNLTDDLKKQGVLGTNEIRDIKDFGFNLGGPLLKDRIWYFFAYSVQDIKSNTVYGNPDDTLLSNYSIKFNAQIIPQNRLETFIQLGLKEKFGREPSTALPAGTYQGQTNPLGASPIIKIQDEHMFGDNLFLSAKYAFIDPGFSLTPMIDRDFVNLSKYNVTQQLYEGSASRTYYKTPVHRASLMANYYNDNLFGVAHDIKLGFEFGEARGYSESGNPGNVGVDYNFNTLTVDYNGDGKPDLYPNIRRLGVDRGTYRDPHVRSYGAFFSDTLTFGRFNLILGLRYDQQIPRISSISIDAVQRSHPVWEQYFTQASTDAIDKIIPALRINEIKATDAAGENYSWKFWSPRVGLTWDVFGDGKTIGKVSAAMYSDQMGTPEANRWMRGGAGGWIDFWWLDANNNWIVDLPELYWHTVSKKPTYQLYRAFDDAGNCIGDFKDASGTMYGSYDPLNPQATVDPYQRIDGNAGSSRTSELMLTLERELFTEFSVSVNASYRRAGDTRWTLSYYPDTGLIESQDWYQSAGTPPVTTVVNWKDAQSQEWYVLKKEFAYTPYSWVKKRPEYHRDFYGVDVIFNKRLSNKWMVNGSLSWVHEVAHYGDKGVLNKTNLWAFENTPVAGYSSAGNYLYSRWMAKIGGLYQLPWDITASLTFLAREGFPIIENLGIVDYSQPNPRSQSATLYLTRFGSERLANFYNLSLRLEKMIKVGDIGKVYLMADIFNALNSAIITTRNYREHGTYYVDNSYFRPNVNDYKATQILNPRVMRLGLRFLF